jgi:O-6-methylguanine DNA methyltransferase
MTTRAGPARVGLCGWTIARAKYVRMFPLVEVQHTFYEPPSDAPTRIYLCHGFCELGAVDAEQAFEDIRSFLEQNPEEVLIIDLEGYTTFQLAVVEALRRVPYGEVVTYGELAALAGRPNAQRAAGSVCAQNRFPLVVPCHRVVSATGIGGYGPSGVEVKRRLLRLEGVSL